MSSQTVEQIKSRVNIVDVVSSYIKLQKAGVNYKALCPFHNEKTPSMSISPERGSFHCFGCGNGGDIFTFVQEMEGLDFVGAMRVLAERAGIEIMWDGKREKRDEKERLYEALREAADFFHSNLSQNRDALLYLKGRGLLAKTAEDFYMGFSPDSWDELYNYLLKKKYFGEEIEKAGLALRAKEGRRGYYDRFRSRIMFPLFDSAGRIVGFSGRIFGKEEGGDAGAKYINTPETLLYNKSKILYGLHKAKQAIREAGSVVVVEGQMDLLMSHQAGVSNTVAVSGTAFSDEHVRTLKRFTEKIIFAFDSDAAGLNATKRASATALVLGMDARAARMIGGKDPADMIRESPDAWRAAIESAEHIVPFLLKILKKTADDIREFRVAVRREILPLIAVISSAIDRDHFVEIAAKETGSSREAVREDLAKSDRLHPTASREESRVKKAPFSRKDIVRRELAGISLWQNDKKRYENLLLESGARFTPDEERELVFSAEAMYGNTKDLKKVIHELEGELLGELLKEERVRITEAIARGDGDSTLGKRHVEISQRLEQLKKRNNNEEKE